MTTRVAGLIVGLGLISAPLAGAEESYTVALTDLDGKPVADAVVYIDSSAVSLSAGTDVTSTDVTIVDQIDSQFSPRISVVQAGASVDFPNSDSVSHHVYSFANPNNFELPLYKGETRPTVSFDHPGLVTLGCNIHDSMLGYILVVDTPHFAVTDANGRAVLTGVAELRDNNPLRVWSPDIGSGEVLSASRDGWTGIAAEAAQGDGLLRFTVATQSDAPAVSATNALSWDDY